MKKSAAPAAKSSSYEYKDLKTCDSSDGKTHFYAVILDAQFPHKSFKSDKYVCSLKIADPSCPIDKNGTGCIEFCTLVMFANKFEDLPISQRVGDIIRVHRASVGLYKSTK